MNLFIHRGEIVLRNTCIFKLVAYFLSLSGAGPDCAVVFGADVFFCTALCLVGDCCNLLFYFDNHFRCVWSEGLIFPGHTHNPQEFSDPLRTGGSVG